MRSASSKGIFHVNAEMPNGAFDLGIGEEDLDCTQVTGRLVDDGRLRAPSERVKAIEERLFDARDSGDRKTSQQAGIQAEAIATTPASTARPSKRRTHSPRPIDRFIAANTLPPTSGASARELAAPAA